MADFKIAYQKEEPNNLNIFLFILITLVFLVVIFIGSYYIYISILSSDMNDKQLNSKYTRYEELKTSYEKNLNSLKFIDTKKKKVKVPIDVGIQHVIKNYN